MRITAPSQNKSKLQPEYKMYIFFLQNTTHLNEDQTLPPDVHNRRKRTAELSLVTSPLTFTATISDRTLPTSVTASSPTLFSDQITNTDGQPTADSTFPEKPSTSYSSASYYSSTNIHSTNSVAFGISIFSPTSMPPATLPPWLTKQSQARDEASDSSPVALTPGQLRLSTLDASITRHFSTRSAAASGTTGGRVLIINTAPLRFLQPSIQGFVSAPVLMIVVCACGCVYPSVSTCMLQV